MKKILRYAFLTWLTLMLIAGLAHFTKLDYSFPYLTTRAVSGIGRTTCIFEEESQYDDKYHVVRNWVYQYDRDLVVVGKLKRYKQPNNGPISTTDAYLVLTDHRADDAGKKASAIVLPGHNSAQEIQDGKTIWVLYEGSYSPPPGVSPKKILVTGPDEQVKPVFLAFPRFDSRSFSEYEPMTFLAAPLYVLSVPFDIATIPFQWIWVIAHFRI